MHAEIILRIEGIDNASSEVISLIVHPSLQKNVSLEVEKNHLNEK